MRNARKSALRRRYFRVRFCFNDILEDYEKRYPSTPPSILKADTPLTKYQRELIASVDTKSHLSRLARDETPRSVNRVSSRARVAKISNFERGYSPAEDGMRYLGTTVIFA